MLTRILSIFISAFVFAQNINAQVITTVAGNGTVGSSGDGGPAVNAQLGDMYYCYPAFDKAGNMYISVSGDNIIRKVDKAGIITTIAGKKGVIGYSGDGGPATNALLYHPNSIVLDNAGNIIFADRNGDIQRKIDLSGTITTILGETSRTCGVGDGGPVAQAQFKTISAITSDGNGNLYTSDFGCNTVRKVDAAGIVKTIAGGAGYGFSGDGGSATAAKLSYPCKVAVDNAGNVYIPDAQNHRIRKVGVDGKITTIAGTGEPGYSGDGGPATAAKISFPGSVVIDKAGNLYIGDYNHVVRKIDAAGNISTYAGNGTAGYSGDGGPAIKASLLMTEGRISIDDNDNIYFVDPYRFIIRKISDCVLPSINKQPVNVNLCNSGDAVFTMSAENATSYKWQILSGSVWTELTDNQLYSGTTSGTLKITGATTSLNGNQYRCVVINSCGNQISLAASLIITPPLAPAVEIQTPTTTICKGKEAIFTAVPQMGGVMPSFTWFKNGIATGAKTDVYTATDLVTGDVITCRLTSTSNCITKTTAESNAITMVVNPSSYCSGSGGSTCSDSLFIKTFLNKDSSLLIQNLITTKTGELMASGTLRSSTAGDDGFIVKWNKNGDIVWQNTYSAAGSQSIMKILQLQDGNFVALGYEGRDGSAVYFILKFDSNGDVISKSDFVPPFSGGSSIAGFMETENKELILTGYFLENNLSFQDRAFFFKFGPVGVGDVRVAKKFTPPGSTNVFVPQSSVVIDGFTYIAGHHFAPIAKGLLVKVNNANGNVVWSKVYDFNGKEAAFSQIFKYPGNKLCIIGSKSYNETDTSLIFITDTSGTVELSRSLFYNSGRLEGKATIDNNGNIIWANFFRKSPNADFTMLAVNPYTGVRWSKNYAQLSNYPFVKGVIISGDSSLFVAGYKNIGRGHESFLGRFSKEGNVGCAPVSLSTDFRSGISTTTAVSLASSDIKITYKGYSVDILHNVIQQGDDICKYQVNCNSLKLQGPATMCSIRDTLKVAIRKNKDCSLTPELLFDSKMVTLLGVTDTSATFSIQLAGVVKISARLMNKCDRLADSIAVKVFNNPSGVNLGADTVLCNGKALMLKPGSNFKSYKWQDGNTDSIYQVTKAGLYFISVTDSCNRVYKDSINILNDTPVSFDLGRDTSKCKNDSIKIVAPAGFTDYTWSPAYNISSTGGQTATVFPAVSAKYYVAAKKLNGCSVSDSIVVNVNRSFAIALAGDTSICSNDSIVLNAGNTFVNYIWSTGDITPSIVVKNAGTYAVSVTDANKCVSKDTFTLKSVYLLPTFSLGNDTAICRNTSLMLRPGSFASYRWHDNSVDNNFRASTTGTYWLEVTDHNSCKSIDTMRIVGLKDLPVHFLPDTLSMCEGDEVTIKPSNSFGSYLWSTGSNQRSVNVKANGSYWLRVVNQDGCTNADTTVITYKSCSNIVYFPTAFTPNGDGKNDLFKAKSFGSLKDFHLVIHNRFGQKIFETKDINAGWDGTIKGTPIESGGFVWYSVYRFNGVTETTQSQKGTLVLIR
jgi:gliding motility-associated-like protein